MARTRLQKKAPSAKKTTAKKPRKAAPRRASRPADPLRTELEGATRTEVGGAVIETCHAGDARVKRVLYPAGFRWSLDMKPMVGTEYCEHAHVGFLAQGAIRIEYPDGCVVDFVAPQVVEIAPGHDGWVVGRRPAVLIEVDFERDTVERLGMPSAHVHA
jgi:hypothetical protein